MSRTPRGGGISQEEAAVLARIGTDLVGSVATKRENAGPHLCLRCNQPIAIYGRVVR